MKGLSPLRTFSAGLALENRAKLAREIKRAGDDQQGVAGKLPCQRQRGGPVRKIRRINHLSGLRLQVREEECCWLCKSESCPASKCITSVQARPFPPIHYTMHLLRSHGSGGGHPFASSTICQSSPLCSSLTLSSPQSGSPFAGNGRRVSQIYLPSPSFVSVWNWTSLR